MIYIIQLAHPAVDCIFLFGIYRKTGSLQRMFYEGYMDADMRVKNNEC